MKNAVGSRFSSLQRSNVVHEGLLDEGNHEGLIHGPTLTTIKAAGSMARVRNQSGGKNPPQGGKNKDKKLVVPVTSQKKNIPAQTSFQQHETQHNDRVVVVSQEKNHLNLKDLARKRAAEQAMLEYM